MFNGGAIISIRFFVFVISKPTTDSSGSMKRDAFAAFLFLAILSLCSGVIGN